MTNVKRKILFVLDNLGYGGVERNTINLANHMSQTCEISIAVLTQSDLILQQFVDSKVNLILFNQKHVLASIPQLTMLFARKKYDLIITAKEYVNVSSLLASLIVRKNNKIVTTTRTAVSKELKNSPLRLSKCYLFLSKILYGKALANVCVSDGVAKDLQEILGLKRTPKTIYNPSAKTESFALTFTSPPHPWFSNYEVIIGCGRLTKQKDFPLLLTAFKMINTNRPNTRLIILGEGELRQDLEQLIHKQGLQDKVLLQGNVPSPEEYMYFAKVFVLSSEWEGFANVIVEALSVGCPVVSMDCPYGPSEILENGKWGRLVRQRTPDTLAHSIDEELSNTTVDPSFLKKRALDFTPEKISKDYLSLIDKGCLWP